MAALTGAGAAAATTFFGAVRSVWVRLKAFLCCCSVEETAEREPENDVDGDNTKVDNIITCCGGRTFNVRAEHPYDREWVRKVADQHQEQQQPVSDYGKYEKNKNKICSDNSIRHCNLFSIFLFIVFVGTTTGYASYVDVR